MTEPTDEMLVERFRQGDQSAFELLVIRYEQTVYNLAYRLTGNQEDAFDLAQEAFLKVYRSLRRFRGQSAFSTWIYRIVTNCFYDQVRKQKRRASIAFSLDAAIPTEEGELNREWPSLEAGPEDISLQQELARVVQAALLDLTPEYRLALVLRDLHGYTYDEIARITDCNLGTVKSRISRARSALRARLQDEELLEAFRRQRD
ncbi:MAG: sigma-70 family RNA polymerase sigma factor [Bacillota bacterium]|jgi:RNA polymerase sigma-70 factor (ECF subfamily)